MHDVLIKVPNVKPPTFYTINNNIAPRSFHFETISILLITNFGIYYGLHCSKKMIHTFAHVYTIYLYSIQINLCIHKNTCAYVRTYIYICRSFIVVYININTYMHANTHPITFIYMYVNIKVHTCAFNMFNCNLISYILFI